jgi:hypothetical protein
MSRRKKLSEADLALFVRAYQRKRQPGRDPNDRAYDRKVVDMIRRMSAEELDALLSADDDVDDG